MRSGVASAQAGKSPRSAIADARLIAQTRAVTRDDHNYQIDRRLVAVGALLGALAVTFGAFGAHALKARLGAEALDWWHTAVEYQMGHAIVILALGLAYRPGTRLPGWLFVAGTLIFSTTLYALALGAPKWLGAVTPLGGLAMIGGWVVLAWRAGRGRLG